MVYNNLFLTPSIVSNTSSAKAACWSSLVIETWNIKPKSELHKLVFILIWEDFFSLGKKHKEMFCCLEEGIQASGQRGPYALRANISAQLQVTRESPLPRLSPLPLLPFPFAPLVLAGLYCNSLCLSEIIRQAF